MGTTIYDRLLSRELRTQYRPSTVRGLYGNKRWVENLDIVNELDGHTGCVNALSWSKSGRLLASGSDDKCVSIHSYLPEDSSKQFKLTTSIATGHQANIFSVKFMPHSNDRIIVSAAGDAEVRIFDIEYSGQRTATSEASSRAMASRHTGFDNRHRGARHLNDGDTDARVFKSHGDRVKRIVTESSPYFFLTCSEDGEVRQWDIRQPSSAYPAQRDSVFQRRQPDAIRSVDVPPPLISYKQYGIDLNTISCSASQPHYIALGGSHVHCFLHDRRMLGRDKLAERGQNLRSSSAEAPEHDEEISRATQCVKRFAPNGKKLMRRNDNGHITACKISDARPNEIIVSWSGDWIYNFDMHASPDARDAPSRAASVVEGTGHRVKGSKTRKRKRNQAGSTLSQESIQRPHSRARTRDSNEERIDDEMALMVQYENGQSEEIPIEPSERGWGAQTNLDLLGESERTAYRIARSTVKLRKQMFTLNSPRPVTNKDPTGHAASFTSVLGFAASVLPEMHEIERTWHYPVDPTEVDVAFQTQLRQDRSSARRFVQASGTLARVLGGKLHMGGTSDALIADYFTCISHAHNERLELSRHEHFGYDFLKAIILWLDSGLGALIEGFSSTSARRKHARLPLPIESDIEDIDDRLIPYLLRLASEKPIINVDSSRFEVDENRTTFATEKAAVLAFARALKIPFADLSSAIVSADSAESSRPMAQDRRTALKFWAFKVGRGVLMNAGRGINFELVDRAHGGLGRGDADIIAEESALRTRSQEIDVGEDTDEPCVRQARLVRRPRGEQLGLTQEAARTTSIIMSDSATAIEHSEADESDGFSEGALADNAHDDDDSLELDTQMTLRDLLQQTAVDDEREIEVNDHDDDNQEGVNDDEGDDDDDNDLIDESDSDDDDRGDEDDDDGEGDEDFDLGQRILWQSTYATRKNKEKVEAHVPCESHIRQYTGHCNVKTVKDVNFYGLDDEYVVSGSDAGHVFIWDQKTTKLLNILEGDGEVVNVVQGHPYEPMLAVSGIDNTVKIFSPDAQARYNARMGIGVFAADASDFPSINSRNSGRRRGRRDQAHSKETSVAAQSAAMQASEDLESEDEFAVAPNGLYSRKRIQNEYQIISENDAARKRGGHHETYISSEMLLTIARHIQARRAEGGNAGADDELLVGPGGDADCSVM